MQPLPAANSKCIWTQKIMTRIYEPEMARQKENCPTLSFSCLLNYKHAHQPNPKVRKQQLHEPLWWSALGSAGAAQKLPQHREPHPARRGPSQSTQPASKRDVDKQPKIWASAVWLQTGICHEWGSLSWDCHERDKREQIEGRCWRGVSKVSKISF